MASEPTGDKEKTPFPANLQQCLWPLVATVWHLILFATCTILLICISTETSPLFLVCDNSDECSPLPTSRLYYLVILCGILGATLTASRYVVQAIRRKSYDLYRLPWQLLTPVHGGILAIIALFVVQAGLVVLGAGSPKPTRTLLFFGALSFLVGFAAESFVKALIRAAEGLFNEKHDFPDTDK